MTGCAHLGQGETRWGQDKTNIQGTGLGVQKRMTLIPEGGRSRDP